MASEVFFTPDQIQDLARSGMWRGISRYAVANRRYEEEKERIRTQELAGMYDRSGGDAARENQPGMMQVVEQSAKDSHQYKELKEAREALPLWLQVDSKKLGYLAKNSGELQEKNIKQLKNYFQSKEMFKLPEPQQNAATRDPLKHMLNNNPEMKKLGDEITKEYGPISNGKMIDKQMRDKADGRKGMYQKSHESFFQKAMHAFSDLFGHNNKDAGKEESTSRRQKLK